jgi:hypothetical protein
MTTTATMTTTNDASSVASSTTVTDGGGGGGDGGSANNLLLSAAVVDGTVEVAGVAGTWANDPSAVDHARDAMLAGSMVVFLDSEVSP